MSSVPVVLVVSTLGRIAPLSTLLDSVAGQLEPGDRLVIVAQDRIDEVRALADGYTERSAGEIRVITSARGASRGRNAGVRDGARDLEDAILLFPNDTSWFPPEAVRAIRRGLGSGTVGAVRVMTSSGPRFLLPPPLTPLDHRNVWSVIEMGLVVRLAPFLEVGGFDESLGTGAPTPWQAGEVTDLLLRLADRRRDVRNAFVWMHGSDAWVGGVEETSGLTPNEITWKLRAYGRGIGTVYRRHPFPLWQKWGFVVAGFLIGVRRGDEYTLRDGVTAFIGRWEGLTGHVRGRRPDDHAVHR